MNTKARRLLLILISVGALLGVVSAWATPASKTPDFSISLDSSTSSITAGQSASYRVTIARTNGFTGSITPSASGLPSGATATFSPNPVPSTATAFVVTVATTTSVNAGSYTLTFTGTSGSLTHSTTAPLTVTAPFSLSITNDNQNISQGNGSTYTVAITRSNFTPSIAFSASGLPSGVSATFDPASTSGNTASLIVQTSPTTPQGGYTFTVQGTSGAVTANVSAHITVSSPKSGKAFTVSGDITQPLAPGVTAPIDLSIANGNNNDLNVTSLSVVVTGTSKSSCDTSNFSVRQFSGTYPLTVPANSTRTLSQLGVAPAQRPALIFVDLPKNQDACKLTSISLAYSGTGQGNS